MQAAQWKASAIGTGAPSQSVPPNGRPATVTCSSVSMP